MTVLPAAKTKSVFLQACDLIALLIAVDLPEPPKLPFTTSAPFAHAYLIELRIAEPGSSP